LGIGNWELGIGHRELGTAPLPERSRRVKELTGYLLFVICGALSGVEGLFVICYLLFVMTTVNSQQSTVNKHNYLRSIVLRIPATKESKTSIQITAPGMNVKRPTPLRIQTNKVMPRILRKMRVDSRI
jgi:hypothetical protein